MFYLKKGNIKTINSKPLVNTKSINNKNEILKNNKIKPNDENEKNKGKKTLPLSNKIGNLKK